MVGIVPVGQTIRFGYRLKVPLALTGVALVSGILVALTTYSLIDRHIEANSEAETRRIAGTLARSLAQPMLRNDVWQAYQTLRATVQPEKGEQPDQAVQVLVLDAQGRVFASPTPRSHPLGRHVSELPAALGEAAASVLASTSPRASRVVTPDDRTLVLAVPVLGDGDALLGVVMASHPRTLAEAQRTSVVRSLIGLGALAMLGVALAGAALGLRLTTPLLRLRAAMRAAPERTNAKGADPDPDGLRSVSERNDEIGDLGRSFSNMMAQIAAQQELERHMLEAERMASIGQLAAGVAHEVNNPLGGMLAAIENRRLRGSLDEPTARTFALLERGLNQIHETAQALLNEARSAHHPLTHADLHDLELLLRPEAERARCTLSWNAALPAEDALPANPVRQVILNLTLNAIGAAGENGEVEIRTTPTPQGWEVRVANSGPALGADRLDALTQGRERSGEGRLGLGLWVTARILHTLGGRLSIDGRTESLATVLLVEFPWLTKTSNRAGARPAASGDE